MTDPCFHPGAFAPAGDALFSADQWSAIQAFGVAVGKIDVGALQQRLASVVLQDNRGWGEREFQPPYVPDPNQVAAAQAEVQPCFQALVVLKQTTLELTDLIADAHMIGRGLAAFTQQAVDQLTSVAGMMRVPEPDAGQVTAQLTSLSDSARANAAQAQRVADGLGTALADTTGTAEQLDAEITSAASLLAVQPGVPADIALHFVNFTLKPATADLQALVPQMQPGLTKMAGAWNALGNELEMVVGRLQKADADVLKGDPCLVENSLTSAINEWQLMAAVVDSFLGSLTVNARAAGVAL